MAEDQYDAAKKHMQGIAGCSCCVLVIIIAAVITALMAVVL